MEGNPRDASGLDPSKVYARRFAGDGEFRRAMWHVLAGWFARWIPPEAVVVEIAAGHCEFINAVAASRRIAIDLNPDTRAHAGPGVEVVIGDARDVTAVAPHSADVVFVSNFFEHLERAAILDTMRAARRMLRPGGRLLVLQPNIRFAARDYWMFFDHVTPIDDRALCEALELCGFEIETVIPRFLPFTTNSALPKSLLLLKLYLRLPLAWRFLGGQAFVVART
ncbi:MAG: class I SAM-dependent methyltransferase [Thermoanaerobaculia bacterium]|jgi:SAM-dependent methyltransferase